MTEGKVYLVGAGPGDPGLITVKGLQCLQKADVVVYDRLIDERLLNEAPSNAEKIFVGKAVGFHPISQEEINKILLRKAQEGKVVVRLKGGDPFVLGRGGEEAKFLSLNKIPFEVVPGVSSFYSVPAYAGIPITHRGLASSVTLITGHQYIESNESNISWEKLSNATDTLVILMGLGNLAYLVEQLIKNHKPPSTPVAVITQGTTEGQRCVTGTLEDIVEKVKSENLNPPSVIVIGEVVQLRKYLRWFDIKGEEDL